MYKLQKLSGDALNTALSFKYLLPGEETFVKDCQDSIKTLENYVHWVFNETWQICGMVSYGMDVDEVGHYCWWIQRLMVRPEYRRRGASKFAIKCAIQNAPEGIDILTSIITSNNIAQNLFTSMGFINTGRYWDQDESIWKLSL